MIGTTLASRCSTGCNYPTIGKLAKTLGQRQARGENYGRGQGCQSSTSENTQEEQSTSRRKIDGKRNDGDWHQSGRSVQCICCNLIVDTWVFVLLRQWGITADRLMTV